MDSQTIAQKLKIFERVAIPRQSSALGNVSYSTVSDWENAKTYQVMPISVRSQKSAREIP